MSVSIGAGVSRNPSDGVSLTEGVGGNGVSGADLPIPLLWIPLAGALNLLRGTAPVTFTRASDGTFEDQSDGLVKTASTNVARFEANGILIEGASTNEALHGRDFTNSVHVKTNITAVKDAIGADGVVNSASTLTATAANGTAFQTVTKASAENTYSIDVRRKTGTGTIEITDDGGSTFTDVTSSINSSTYSRFEITTTQANPSFGVRIVTSGDEVEVDYTGLEALPFASSRIETVASTVTRAADNLSVPSSNIPAPTADYSVSAEVDVLGINIATQSIMQVRDEVNRIYRAVDVARLDRTVGFSGSAAIQGSVPTAGTTVKNVITSDGVTLTLYKDGAVDGSGAVGSAITGTKTSITIGSSGTAALLFGHIKDFKIFDIALTPTQVAAL